MPNPDRMPLATMLWSYRAMERISVRDLAKRTGISIATISRIENDHLMDAATLARLLNWMLGINDAES